jgi:hypothetical protein
MRFLSVIFLFFFLVCKVNAQQSLNPFTGYADEIKSKDSKIEVTGMIQKLILEGDKIESISVLGWVGALVVTNPGVIPTVKISGWVGEFAAKGKITNMDVRGFIRTLDAAGVETATVSGTIMLWRAPIKEKPSGNNGTIVEFKPKQ